MRHLSRLGLALLAVAAVGCGGDDPQEAPQRTVALPPGLSAPKILALSAGPSAGGDLLINTDQGLLRVAPKATEAVLVERSVVTAAGPRPMRGDALAWYTERGELLGSGHPVEVSAEAPSDLGLLQSGDGGASWTAVALSGQADFHLLDVRGSRLYGYDLPRNRLMLSRDLGKRFEEHQLPALLFDLVVDPADDRHLIAATDRGPLESRDGGAGWRPSGLGGEVRSLAWPRPDALVGIDETGEVRRSSDGGRSAERAGDLGARPTAPTAERGRRVYVASTDLRVLASDDAGATWRTLLRLR